MWNTENSTHAKLSGDQENSPHENIRKSKVISITPTHEDDWIFKRLHELAQQCNSQAYRFNISGFYEPLQLAQYEKSDFFDWHLDFGVGEASTRKLSITVQLSEPDSYEGGQLQFKVNNQVIDAPNQVGTAIIFPSFITHRVSTITSGKRRSLVGWVSGNHFS